MNHEKEEKIQESGVRDDWIEKKTCAGGSETVSPNSTTS